MQWTELLGTCHACRDQNRVVLTTDKCNLVCRSCGGGRFEDIQVIPICGFVYVLSNPRMPGLLKIGYTERAVEDRAAEVSSGTGIRESFVVEAYFGSSNPLLDERTVHQSLKQYRLVNREFFELDLDQSLQVLYQVVGRKPHFLRDGLTFETPEEQQRRVTANIEKDRDEFDPKLEDLGDSLKNEVLSLRAEWSSTGGAATGVSLIYRLIYEERYLDAKRVVDLFLSDNPDHGVALRQREKIDAAIGKERTLLSRIRSRLQGANHKASAVPAPCLEKTAKTT